MADHRGVLREISWRELFPWLLLVRVFRLAIHPGLLGTAIVALLLTSIGWKLDAVLFRLDPKTPDVLVPDAVELGRWPSAGRRLDPDFLAAIAHPQAAFSHRSPVRYVFDRLSLPMRGMYRPQAGLKGFAFYLFGTLWTLAVWAWAGGVITRFAVVELGREETPSFRRTCMLATKRWLEYFTAPLYPFLGTVLIALLTMPVGWMIWLGDAGTISAGILWIFVVIGGMISALLLIWLAIGWPLMWPTISAEETGDAFEAMSRSFSYAFQRPLHYLFYAFVAAYLGMIGWAVVELFCETSLQAAHWSVSWGAGHERTAVVLNAVERAPSESVTALGVGASMIGVVEGLLRAVSEAFAYTYFWVAAAAIYLLLRHNIDRAEFDDVWADDDVARYPLPQLQTDAAGVPGVETPSTVQPPTPPTPNPPMENNQAE